MDSGADATGDVVFAGAGGRVGEGGESLLGCAGVSFLRLAGVDPAATGRRTGSDDLRVGRLLRTVFFRGPDGSLSSDDLSGWTEITGRRLHGRCNRANLLVRIRCFVAYAYLDD